MRRKRLFFSIGIGLGAAVMVLGTQAVARVLPGSWQENWDSDSPAQFLLLAPGDSEAHSNSSDPQAEDGKALELVLAAGSAAGPGNGPEIETLSTREYGTYSTRLKIADCSAQPNAGVVTGYFIYFNDGSDADGDGLADNTEIDFEWLCAEPQTVYLTMWTDYRDSDEAHQRVGRAINLQSGEIEYSCYFEAFGDCQRLSGIENQPESVAAMPTYDSSAGYAVYGFQWTRRRVTWWMENPATGQRVILWDYQGLERIPDHVAYFMTNVWHTATWTPPGLPGAVEAPNAPLSGRVDWTRFEPLPGIAFLPLVGR